MKIKPYDTALELKNYLDKTNRTQIRDICDSLFNEREHIENLKYLTQIKVLWRLYNFSSIKSYSLNSLNNLIK